MPVRSLATAWIHAITAFWRRAKQVRLPAELTPLVGCSMNSRYWADRTGVERSPSRASGTLASWDWGLGPGGVLGVRRHPGCA